MLGERIAQCRKACGLSQSGLAMRLNISPSTVGMYEQGRREPPCDILVALSRELNVTLDYLLTGASVLHHSNASCVPFNLRNTVSSVHQIAAFSKDELIVLVAALLVTGKNN